MSASADLVEQIAEVLRTCTTHDQMPSVALGAGLVIPEAENAMSKRDRARQALAGKSDRELGKIARLLGLQLGDFNLEEAGLFILEYDSLPITEITRRDVAKCFGDDLSGEQNIVTLVRKLFNVDGLESDFLWGRSLASEIEQHVVRNPGDWDVEFLFEQIGALNCSLNRFCRLIEAALHPLGRRGLTIHQFSSAHG